MKLVVAFDSWKGCLTAGQAGRAASDGFASTCSDYLLDVSVLPLADGGEGTLRFISSHIGGKMCPVDAHDALMRPLTAPFLMCRDGKPAVGELASTWGLTLLQPDERNVMQTTTYGFGEQIAAAVAAGATDVTCALGGSATNDAGLGALQALGLQIYMDGELLLRPVTGADLDRITRFDTSALQEKLQGVTLRYLYDARIPFYGEQGAVNLYAAQKGASISDLSLLEDGMENVAVKMNDAVGRNPEDFAGAGAAGGTGGGLAALAGAEPLHGIEYVLDTINFNNIIKGAALVITGEGKADAQTRQGKVPDGVLRRAKAAGVPVVLMAGQIEDREQLEADGYSRVININEDQLNPSMDFPAGDNPLDPVTALHRIFYAAALLNVRNQ